MYNRFAPLSLILLLLSIPVFLFSQDSPTMLGVNVLGEEGVQVNWFLFETEGVSSFNIYRGSSLDDLMMIASTADASMQFYLDNTAPTNDSQLFYAVSSLSEDGAESELSDTHGTLFLQLDYVECEGSVQLNWVPYVGWDELASYNLFENFLLTDNLDSELTELSLDLSEQLNGELCYSLSASRDNITQSTSNTICFDFCGGISTSISSISFSDVLLYPNPSSEYIRFQLSTESFEGLSQYTVQFYNTNGQKQLSLPLEECLTDDILIQDWMDGVYIYVIEDDSGQLIESRSFIKH